MAEQGSKAADTVADELVFYDISPSAEGRSVDRVWVEKVTRMIDIPFCVAGGIRSVDRARCCMPAPKRFR